MGQAYRAVRSKREALSISHEKWVCVVEKVSLELRHELLPERLKAYEVLKPYEGSWCLFDRNIPARILKILNPPQWSFFSNEEDMWDWFQLGNSWGIWLPKAAR